MGYRKRKTELEQVVKTFHQCTGLVIAGFTANGELACCQGAKDELLQTLLEINREMQRDCEYTTQYGQFVLVSVCRHCTDQGHFFVGPFGEGPDGVEARPLTTVTFLVRLLRFIQDHNLTRFYSPVKEKICCLHVQRALDYMGDHYNEQISLQQLAHLLGLNKSYLSNLFRTETGRTFCEWLNQIRIERSKDYLKHTDQTISAIALAVGYTSQSYYTSMFSKHVGETPNTYRLRWLRWNDTTEAP